MGVESLARENHRSGNVKRFRGGLVFKDHILVYHSTLGLRVIKKKKKKVGVDLGVASLPREKRRSSIGPSSMPAVPGVPASVWG